MTIAEFIIALLIIFLAGIYLYYIGTVLVQALKVGILKANAEIKMKIEEHQENLRQRKALFESRFKALPGSGKEEGKVEEENMGEVEKINFDFSSVKGGEIISMQINFDENQASSVEDALKKIKGVKRHVSVGNSVFVDINASLQTPANLMAEMRAHGINVLQAKVISGEKEKERIDSYELEI